MYRIRIIDYSLIYTTFKKIKKDIFNNDKNNS